MTTQEKMDSIAELLEQCRRLLTGTILTKEQAKALMNNAGELVLVISARCEDK